MSARTLALVDDGGARHLQRSRRMPDIELPTTAGANVNFARLAGRVVLYCYPWTGRPSGPGRVPREITSVSLVMSGALAAAG